MSGWLLPSTGGWISNTPLEWSWWWHLNTWNQSTPHLFFQQCLQNRLGLRHFRKPFEISCFLFGIWLKPEVEDGLLPQQGRVQTTGASGYLGSNVTSWSFHFSWSSQSSWGMLRNLILRWVWAADIYRCEVQLLTEWHSCWCGSLTNVINHLGILNQSHSSRSVLSIFERY